MLTESRIAEEKAKKAMIDAARLADELRAEQENAQLAERSRRVLDNQVKDMQTKLDEAEQLAVKGGKKVVSRLELKIKDLESQLVGSNDLITQYKHELQVKTDLLHVYTHDVEDASPLELRSFNVELLQKKINDLEEENKSLHDEASKVKNIY